MFRTFRDKLYPGAEVELWNVDLSEPMDNTLRQHFSEYMGVMHLSHPEKSISIFDVANDLNLGFEDRLKFVQLPDDRKSPFIITRLKYQIALLKEAEKAKDVYHLN